jgi:gliding motility-associated-like protein
MNKIKSTFIFAVIFSVFPVIKAQTLVTSSGLTATQYVQNILLGPGVTASGITFSGYANAIGKFSVVGPNALGIDSGLVLTTGTVLNTDINGPGPHGPNNSGNSGFDNFGGSDADLNLLGGGTGSFNAAVLEFDFTPSSDTIKFDFAFGSEEYMEFVDLGVSDAFGFFLSGPGIAGPYSNGAINIALVPGTNTPITIDSLNAGDHGAYYVDNETPPGQLLQYDGFTTVLTAIGAVQCNQTYHIKIAITDMGDGVWDSGVFLKAGSFSSNGGLEITGGALINDSLTTDSIFTEGCQQAVYIFSRPDSNGVDTIFFHTGGTATEGTDYTDVPDFIVIGQGDFADSIVISAFDDPFAETIETVTIFITYDNPCGIDTIEKTLYLRDYQKMVAIMGGDTVICPGLGSFPVLDPVVTGGFGGYHYLWYPTQDTTDTLVAALGQTTVFYVNIEDDCGKTITSAPVTIVKQCPVIIPNVITANDDGTNDVFFIQNIGDYPENEVWFFNRWGTELHYQKHYANDWKPDVTDGVYFYVVDTKVGEPFRGFFSVFANP